MTVLRCVRAPIQMCVKKRGDGGHARHSIQEIATQPVNLWILLGGKPKWLPLNFGFNEKICTAPLHACTENGAALYQLRPGFSGTTH